MQQNPNSQINRRKGRIPILVGNQTAASIVGAYPSEYPSLTSPYHARAISIGKSCREGDSSLVPITHTNLIPGIVQLRHPHIIRRPVTCGCVCVWVVYWCGHVLLEPAYVHHHSRPIPFPWTTTLYNPPTHTFGGK